MPLPIRSGVTPKVVEQDCRIAPHDGKKSNELVAGLQNLEAIVASHIGRTDSV
jgi:hypothetical protein